MCAPRRAASRSATGRKRPAAGNSKAASLSFEGLSDLCGPYDGTDWLGHAFHVVKLGDAGRLPVCICWSSAPNASSKWLGRGWSIPLLESRIFPIGEKSLELHLPDGYVRYFHCGRDGLYVGGRFWTAERRPDEIRVTADSKDGFPKSVYVFRRGHLQKMDCAEGTFEFRSDATGGDTVVSRGRTVLAARARAGEPNEVRLEVGGARIMARKRPAQLALAPSNFNSRPVTVEEPCLSELVFPDGSSKVFEYGVDGGEATFEAGGKTWCWDASTRRVLSCNGYRFRIGDRLNDMSGPTFERIDDDGHRESFSRDVQKGVTTVRSPDGSKVVTRYFTSGDNAGRVRGREWSVGDWVQKRIDYIYDSRGRVWEELVRGEDD